ncbi:MAG: hypothetical protein C5B50_27970 [Verrucomicrobia bacterium]|nr:MAG: hypothetical protein C5B50_27970 [Verrucomicrobiota bacterium]
MLGRYFSGSDHFYVLKAFCLFPGNGFRRIKQTHLKASLLKSLFHPPRPEVTCVHSPILLFLSRFVKMQLLRNPLEPIGP